ncbi:hypothetical protein HY380_02100 [Candidatus Saccharibacteria bacterium]|nr:hypothetical protein [Candidatus Saccharibacteria bacterium]
MDDFSKMLKNANVNNYATAIIFGFATFNFFNSVGSMLFGDWFDTGSAWAWGEFWTSLVVYVVLFFVAWWVNSMAKG